MVTAVGFIGLGNMGLHMCRNLLEYVKNQNIALNVFNRTRSKADELVANGAVFQEDPKSIAATSDIVFTVVANDSALESVFLGDNGLLAGVRPGTIFVDHSTVLPETAKRLSDLAAAKQAQYISSPVFGRPEAAAARMLWVLSAGPADAKEKVKPFQQAMGRAVQDVSSEAPRANVLKLTGNFMIVSTIEMLAEGMTLAEKNGLERGAFMEMVQALFPGPIHSGYGGRLAADNFNAEGGFQLTLGMKDVGHMKTVAQNSACPLPLADLIYNHMLGAKANGREEYDWLSLASIVRENAGLPSGLPEKKQ
eukprot:GILK01007121.1.p1 GENE.GILK01007121.1~~GILK01007121.1.p1  ORF type:complete len:320 (-),score=56.80 GILK01007121.1:86-1009(-)